MEDRIIIAQQYIDQGWNKRFVLNTCQVPKSTWYDRKKTPKAHVSATNAPRGRPCPGYSFDIYGNPVLDSSIVFLLKHYRSQVEFMNAAGCKVLRHYFRREHGLVVNHKKIYRLCKENNLLLPRQKKKHRKNVKVSINRKITGPNQLWQFDIKYGYIHGENRHFYLAAFKDVFDKEIVGYHIGLNCKAKHLKFAFEQSRNNRKLPNACNLVIRSDNGPQMASHQFREHIDTLCTHEFIPPGCPNKNAYIESFFSLVETEFLQVRYFKKISDAYRQLVDWIDHYNQRRLHSSTDYLPPRELHRRYEGGEYQRVLRKS